MLNRDAIDKIEELAHAHELIQEIGDRQFHVSTKGAVAVEFPETATIEVFSLSQLVNLIESVHGDYGWSDESGHTDGGLLVNIDDFDKVSVMTKDVGENGDRETVAKADFSDVFEKFPFGQQLSQEDFIIKLMTQFEKDGNRDALMKMVLSVKAEKIQTSDDDGYSQVAAVKAGVHLQSEKKIDNLWVLKTYRTFCEVEQPAIPYILRLHQRDAELPKFALYPCDGGQWKVTLTLAIRGWLENQLKVKLGEAYGKGVIVL